MSGALAQSVRINEVMYVNKTTLTDQFNETPDFIELYNEGNAVVNLENWRLTDDSTETESWMFPNVSIASKSYLLVFASGRNTVENGELHTDFKLKQMRDSLYLFNAQKDLVSYVPVQCVPTDMSLGFLNGKYKVLTPSPGESNALAKVVEPNFVSDTVLFSKPQGFYANSVELELENNYSKNTIYYTLDGDDPTEKSLMYTVPITIVDRTPEKNRLANIPAERTGFVPGNDLFKATPVRAVVYSGGCPASNIVSATYFVHPEVKGKYPVPVVSVLTDKDNLFDPDEGIYHLGNNNNSLRHGKKWEREGNVEFFSPHGDLLLKQHVGIRIHGAGSRMNYQKTLRLYAREEYGEPTFGFSPFEEKPRLSGFKRLLLRHTCDWSHTMFTDELTAYLVRNMNVDYQAGQSVVVFIDGEYWGIHSLKERQDIEYLKQNYGVSSAVDVVSYLEGHGIMVAEGCADNYYALTDFIENNPLVVDENYQVVEDWVDIDNIIDFYIAQLYFANNDFPKKNVKFWREKKEGAKWRALFYDCDACMMQDEYDHLSEYNNEEGSFQRYSLFTTFLLRNLLKNERFRQQFTQQFYYHLNTTFSAESVVGAIKSYEKLYEPLVVEHTYRWGQPLNVMEWKGNVETLYQFAVKRPSVMVKQLEENFESPVQLYPNPSQGDFCLEIPPGKEVLLKVTIYSASGQMLESTQYRNPANGKLWLRPGLRPGFYLLELQYGELRFTEKILIQ
jgi:hypothetical protein